MPPFSIDTVKDNKKAPRSSSVISTDLIDETLLTLSLLLSSADESSQRWFDKARKRCPQEIDPAAARNFPGRSGRAVDRYMYWRDRLELLADAFDRTDPKDVRQWWFDRRKRVQWYTFWVAGIGLLLTVLFGLTQSVTGIVQVYAVYHPPA